MAMRLVTTSMYRHNGGIRVKRTYGSSTVTTFNVHRPEDKDDPSRWVTVDAYGPTPGDRSTDAKRRAEPLIRAKLAEQGVKVD
jgi:hypothetical protein